MAASACRPSTTHTPQPTHHAGGADSILLVAGTDATEEFNAIHSAKAKAMLTDYYIGDLEGAANPTGPMPAGGGLGAAVANGAAANGAAANGAAAANGTVANGAAANGTAANGAVANGSAANGAVDLVALNPKKKQAFKLVGAMPWCISWLVVGRVRRQTGGMAPRMRLTWPLPCITCALRRCSLHCTKHGSQGPAGSMPPSCPHPSYDSRYLAARPLVHTLKMLPFCPAARGEA